MKYRITNKSHQEGMISIQGKWESIQPGEVRYSDVKPGECTGNIRVTNVLTAPVVQATVTQPVTNQAKTIYSQKADPKAKPVGGK